MQPGLDNEIELMCQVLYLIAFAIAGSAGKLCRYDHVAPCHFRGTVSTWADNLYLSRWTECIKDLGEHVEERGAAVHLFEKWDCQMMKGQEIFGGVTSIHRSDKLQHPQRRLFLQKSSCVSRIRSHSLPTTDTSACPSSAARFLAIRVGPRAKLYSRSSLTDC